MPVWPRPPADGQDQKHFPYGTLKVPERREPERREPERRPFKTDREKFEDGLTAAIGAKAAKTYIRRKQRRESEK
jgi:hypothetical protein